MKATKPLTIESIDVDNDSELDAFPCAAPLGLGFNSSTIPRVPLRSTLG
ncbi:MAG TPA: hypothetical protein VG649_08080 [Candidatus Angelobacter sp.]|jgi:hypothetical protein|nr:hypothetical protein [Candidatus Angelobacter sp.]